MEPQDLGLGHAQQQTEEPRGAESEASDYSSPQSHSNLDSTGTEELVDENEGTTGQLTGTTSTSNEQSSNLVSQQDSPGSSSSPPLQQSCPGNTQANTHTAGSPPPSEPYVFLYSIALEDEEEDWKHIRRAAHLYQEIYMHIRELTYNRALLSVHEEARSLRIIKDGRNLFAYRGEHATRRFPRHLFRSEDNAHSMLLFRGCEDHFFFARSLFEQLIRPYCSRVYQMVFIPRDIHLRIKLLPEGDSNADNIEDSTTYGHNILFLETMEDDYIVFDPTGAQFGWGDVIAPGISYLCDRRPNFNELEEFDVEEEEPCHGPGDIDWETVLGEQGTLSLPQGVDFIRKVLMHKAISAFKAELQNYANLEADDLVRVSNETVFRVFSKVVLDKVKQALEMDVARLEASPLAKVIPCGDDSLSFEITTTRESFDLWKDSWLTEQETEGCKERSEVEQRFRAKQEAGEDTETESTPKAKKAAGKQSSE